VNSAKVIKGAIALHLETSRTEELMPHIPHPLLSQSVFTEFSELMESLFIQRSGKSVVRSQIQNPQKAKIPSVTLQGAECGLMEFANCSDNPR